jgi:Flp pilus assembly protein TadG
MGLYKGITMLATLRRFKREDRAAAAVEFALVLPLVLVLLFGIIDMGRLLFTANSLTSAVREGARFAAVDPSPTQAEVVARIRGQLDAAVSTPKVTDAQVILATNAAARTVTVSVNNYQFSTITPFANLVGLGTVTLGPSATLRWERAP